MNLDDCTCFSPVGRLVCPVHPTHYATGPGVKFPRWAGDAETGKDRTARPRVGEFHGMDYASLDNLALAEVGATITTGGREVWRWEESSPITRLLSDARPEGSVELPESWMLNTQRLGEGKDSPLGQALLRWPGRTWHREDVPGRWAIRIHWAPRKPATTPAVTA